MPGDIVTVLSPTVWGDGKYTEPYTYKTKLAEREGAEGYIWHTKGAIKLLGVGEYIKLCKK